MPLQPPSAYPAGSVMTRLWCHRAQFDGQLKKARNRISTTSSTHKLIPIKSTPSSSSSSATATLLQQSTKYQSRTFKSDVITQIKKLTGQSVLLLFIVLCVFAQPVTSKPWSSMQENYVVFRSRICQSVSQIDLQKLMGSHFDKNRMSSDLANPKRSFDSTSEALGNAGYQGDEPRFGLAVESSYFVEDPEGLDQDSDVWVDTRGENIYTENDMIDEIGDQDIVERRTVVSGKNILNKRVPNRNNNVVGTTSHRKVKSEVNDDDFLEPSDNKRQTIYTNSYSYMKRKRRRSIEERHSSPRSNNYEGDNPNLNEEYQYENANIDEYDIGGEESSIESKDKKSLDKLHIRLATVRANDKKTKKILKKKLRQKLKNLTLSPPWECKFSQSHKRMQGGIFPEILLDGKCDTDKCFYRLYNCDPIKYAVKLLRRDPEKCNPLPSVGNNTIYEERWELIQYHVTVGCNCASPNIKNIKPKNRRRD